MRGWRRPFVVLAVGAVLAGSGVYGYGRTTGGGTPAANFSGTFDCYGSTPNCVGLTPATCTGGAWTISSGLQTALNNATGGEVICLSSASTYGDITVTGKGYSSTVTVQPVSGVAATVGSVNVNATTNLRFTGAGAASLSSTSLTLNGSFVDVSSGCSSNVTFDHIAFRNSGSEFYGGYSCSHGLNILWDHDRFDYAPPGTCEHCRIWLREGISSGLTDGVTISNSLIANGCADGIYTDGASFDPAGTVIGPGNEFTNLDQNYSDANCGGVHIDPIGQFYPANEVVVGNYFHDNGSGSGGILDRQDPNMIVKNNVFATVPLYPNSILVKTAQNNTVTHNVLAGGVSWPDEGEGACVGGVIRNNIFESGNVISAPTCSPTADHNLGIDVGGSPTYLTGTGYTGYYAYIIASNSSVGYNAGSDGKSLGICSTCG